MYTCVKTSHFGGRKDCSVSKSTHCFCRGPEFIPSPHIKWFTMSVTPAPGVLVLSSGLGEHGIHVCTPQAEYKNHIFLLQKYVPKVPIKQTKKETRIYAYCFYM